MSREDGWTIYDPPTGWRGLGLHELWAHRELALFLALRDIRLRYRQTAFGVAWALIPPLATAALYTLVFGRWLGVGTGGVSYPAFALAALLPWQVFAFIVANASPSLAAQRHLVTRVAIPRLVIPVAAGLPALVDFSFALAAAILVAWGSGLPPSWRVVAIVPSLLLTLAAAYGLAVGLSALCVRYRDVPHTLPFLLQFGMYSTPILYSVDAVPTDYLPVFALNPLVSAVQGFRFALLGATAPPPEMLVVSTIAALTLLGGSLVYFRRAQATFAETV